jgi:hypothetical protein
VRAAGVHLDLTSLRPFLGLAAETLLGDIEIEPPSGGVAVVENFAAFEACCREEVSGLKNTLVIWTAGYPGRAVKAAIQAASHNGPAMRIWADLDLDGVRIVRLVADWLSGAIEPFGMSPEHVATAPARRPLSPRSASAIRSDLAARPAALLADTLRALLTYDCWVEQEAFLGAASRESGVGARPGGDSRGRSVFRYHRAFPKTEPGLNMERGDFAAAGIPVAGEARP